MRELATLRDRHEPMDLFALLPRLGLTMDPILTQLDHLLDDDIVFHQVKADLARRYPHTLIRGRLSTPVEVILWMLVIKRLYRWSYAEMEHFVGDSLVLRPVLSGLPRSSPRRYDRGALWAALRERDRSPDGRAGK